jgi:hypothetical protein
VFAATHWASKDSHGGLFSILFALVNNQKISFVLGFILYSDVHRSLNGGYYRQQTHLNVWEPGENPGRLRHCNGYKFQVHWSQDREGGIRLEAEVRIPV